MTEVKNIFSAIAQPGDAEQFDELLRSSACRIERIVSQGHVSPESGWYDQHENEWIIVLQGSGRLSFSDGSEVTLGPGDYLHIPAHCRHRVIWTTPEKPTLWLAVFYRD